LRIPLGYEHRETVALRSDDEIRRRVGTWRSAPGALCVRSSPTGSQESDQACLRRGSPLASLNGPSARMAAISVWPWESRTLTTLLAPELWAAMAPAWSMRLRIKPPSKVAGMLRISPRAIANATLGAVVPANGRSPPSA